MARYIDADDLKAVIKANDWSNPVVPDVVGVIIDRTPTADVVPKSEVAEIFAEFELHIRKAVEGWRKEFKFTTEKDRMDMIMARLDAFGYCIYELDNLKKKYKVATDEKAET